MTVLIRAIPIFILRGGVGDGDGLEIFFNPFPLWTSDIIFTPHPTTSIFKIPSPPKDCQSNTSLPQTLKKINTNYFLFLIYLQKIVNTWSQKYTHMVIIPPPPQDFLPTSLSWTFVFAKRGLNKALPGVTVKSKENMDENGRT